MEQAVDTPTVARPVCGRCARPLQTCYCTALPPEPLHTVRTRVVVLQHTNEQRQRQSISSVPLLTHVLTTPDSVVVLPVHVNAGTSGHVADRLCASLTELLHPLTVDAGDVDAVCVLYPHEDARSLAVDTTTTITTTASSQSGRTVLVAVDGTWAEAKRIVHHSRGFWDAMAAQLRARGKRFDFVCLPPPPATSTDGGSIYGELRKEPMPGCVSTLEAVAASLRVLEGTNALSDPLCSAFAGMVARQTAFLQRGRALQMAKHGGTPKPKGGQAPPTGPITHTTTPATVDSQDQQSTAVSTSDGVIKQYVFYTTQTDLRKRQRLLQEGETRVCTRDEALAQCAEMNRTRKRGHRISAIPLEAFERQARAEGLVVLPDNDTKQ